MMIKKKSNPWACLKYLYILPLAAASVAAFARPEVSGSLDEISSVKVNDLASIMKADVEKNVGNLPDEKVKVAGKVVDEISGKPLSGVSIIVRNTSNGTLAVDGKFSIECNEGDVLLFSFIGMQTQSVIVPKGGSESMVVSMKEEVQSLEEMMIVGYASDGEGTVLDGKAIKNVVQVTDIPAPKDESDGEKLVFQLVEEMPSFPGGMKECMMFLAKNMKYPLEAQKAKIEGRVIVQFVVDKDGSITDAKVVRNVSPELDAEAVRVVNSMPKWNPGKQRGMAVAVKYTMPVMFRLQKAQELPMTHVTIKAEKDVDMGTVNDVKQYLRKNYTTHITYETLKDTSDVIRIRTSNEDEKPLIIIDGEFKGFGSDVLNSLKPQDIESISVLKKETGVAKYGEMGKNGVILVTTKKAG